MTIIKAPFNGVKPFLQDVGEKMRLCSIPAGVMFFEKGSCCAGKSQEMDKMIKTFHVFPKRMDEKWSGQQTDLLGCVHALHVVKPKAR